MQLYCGARSCLPNILHMHTYTERASVSQNIGGMIGMDIHLIWIFRCECMEECFKCCKTRTECTKHNIA